MKSYTLFRHLGEPGVKALEFRTPVELDVRPRKFGNSTAAELRELAAEMERPKRERAVIERALNRIRRKDQ
jgi:hypothetical protein